MITLVVTVVDSVVYSNLTQVYLKLGLWPSLAVAVAVVAVALWRATLAELVEESPDNGEPVPLMASLLQVVVEEHRRKVVGLGSLPVQVLDQTELHYKAAPQRPRAIVAQAAADISAEEEGLTTKTKQWGAAVAAVGSYPLQDCSQERIPDISEFLPFPGIQTC
jgi:hypothetical protein